MTVYLVSFIALIAVGLIIWVALGALSLQLEKIVKSALTDSFNLTDEEIKADGDHYLLTFEKHLNAQDAVQMAEAILKAEASRLRK